MTLEEYESLRDSRPCDQCGALGVTLERCDNNNGLAVRCPSCQKRHAWDGVMWLQQSSKKRRPPLPGGETPAEVWARLGDYCWGCGTPRDTLAALRVGIHAHHSLPYAQHGHSGAVVPLCARCHESVTATQKTMQLVVSILLAREVGRDAA